MANETADRVSRSREHNARSTELAAEALVVLVPRLVDTAMITDDPEVIRRSVETLGRLASNAEPKQPQVLNAPLTFSIILDPNIPQTPPPRSSRARALDVLDAVDAVDISGAAPAAPALVLAPPDPPGPFSALARKRERKTRAKALAATATAVTPVAAPPRKSNLLLVEDE